MTNLLHKTAKSARQHRFVATLLGVLVLLGAAAAVYAAVSPDFSVSAQPPNQTVGSGGTASYVISISPTNGFSGPVTLTAGALPKGSSASWTVGTTTIAGSSATVPAGAGTRAARLTINTANPPAGSYSPTVTATSGSLKHTATLTLVVLGQNGSNFTVAVSPAAQTVAQGTIGSTIAISRTGFTGPVSFSPVSGLPPSTSATIIPTSTTGSQAALTITTSMSTPPGLYSVVVAGSGTLSGKTVSTRYSAFTLNVLPPFAISGSLVSPMRLGAGGTQRIDLGISNPYSTPLQVSNIQVALGSIQQAANAAGTCNQTGVNSPNFTIANLPAAYTVTVPANGTAYLSHLGTGVLPSVTWVDQAWPQNGCLNAKLNFSYSANGQF